MSVRSVRKPGGHKHKGTKVSKVAHKKRKKHF